MYRIFRLGLLSLFSLQLLSMPSRGQVIEAAQWIGDGHDIEYRPASIYRDTFWVEEVEGPAIFKIASLGIHEVEINGHRVGDEFLNPVFTDFSKRLFEIEYEVTDLIVEGQYNTVTVTLGNGFYNYQPVTNWRMDLAPWRDRPSFSASLYDTISNEILSQTDETWRFVDSPWFFNSIWLGEGYDQRLLIKDIHNPTINTASWAQPVLLDPPDVRIEPQPDVGIELVEVLHPVSIQKVNSVTGVFAFERNFAGAIHVIIPPLATGQEVSFKYGEQTNEEGFVDHSNLAHPYKERVPGENFQTDRLISNGRDTLEFTNRFSYQGFQFVEVKSSRALDFKKLQLEAYVLSSTKRVSSFESSDESLNSLWRAANNSIEANMHGLPTDCPTREKNGWTGDGYLMLGACAFNFDVDPMFRKWATDHRDAQLASGLVPNVVPTGGFGVDRNFFDWTVSTIWGPWSHYLYYGDASVLSENYASMKLFMTHWQTQKANNLLTTGIGDWKASVYSSVMFMSSTLYFDALRKMAQIAETLDETADQESFESEAASVRKTIHQRYYRSEEGIYSEGTQTELGFALYYGIIPNEEIATKVGQALLERVQTLEEKVEVGVLGVMPLLGSLHNMGRSDVAHRLVTNPNNDIWMNWLQGGSKSLYEGPGYKPEKRYGGSQNHMYFGSYNEWIASGLAGISPAFYDPAFETILLQPAFVEELEHLNWRFKSAIGEIGTRWNFVNDELVRFEVTLPKETNLLFDIPDGYQVREVEPIDVLQEATINNNGQLSFFAESFIIDLERAGETVDETIVPPKLYFDGVGIYSDQQAYAGQAWDFEIYDLGGRLVHSKRITFMVKHVPILSLEEIPDSFRGTFVGRLINLDTNEMESTIKFNR